MVSFIKNNIFLSLYTIFASIMIAIGFNIDLKSTTSLFDQIGLGLSTSLSLLAVYFILLEIKEKFSMFIVGIISSILGIIYLWVYSPLLWDMTISFFYLGVGIYGLINWQDRSTNPAGFEDASPLLLTKKQVLNYIILWIVGVLVLFAIGYQVGKYSSSLQAIVDSVTTVSALIAWWFTTKKYIASWYLWILVNVLSVPLYISIGSYTMAMMYAGYVFMSFYGWKCWKDSMNK
ncbi:MAG: nicotinamide riboside transporter PnuC [Brevinema sp.]